MAPAAIAFPQLLLKIPPLFTESVPQTNHPSVTKEEPNVSVPVRLTGPFPVEPTNNCFVSSVPVNSAPALIITDAGFVKSSTVTT